MSISIHASAKEATTVSSFSGVTEYFNPRLREGGDKEYHRNNGGKKNFNPRLREGGDGIQRHNRLEESKISIHASAKEATAKKAIGGLYYQYFNPRLREGGDFFPLALPFKVCISIHASAKEATICGKLLSDSQEISIHASAKEATTICFGLVLFIDISIHASAKEATIVADNPLLSHFDFNPRLREGGDPLTVNLISSNLISIHASAKEATDWFSNLLTHGKFQSTPPRRRRQSWTKNHITATQFQSTPPRRRRRRGLKRSNLLDKISIHASAKEATQYRQSRRNYTDDFNPRLREGGDCKLPSGNKSR